MRRAAAALGLLVAAGRADASNEPCVAVMPFKDLSSASPRSSIGEAISETVTSDLSEVPGLRVIERAHIEKAIAELHLNASKTDLDSSSTVKVGRLLSATLIVVGSYQRVAATIRLNARFVAVATGEIVGTAKVDGAASDFLRVQDLVSVELLKSAKIAPEHVRRFARRPRPRLKSLKTIELYGDAVVAADDGQRKQYLLAAVVEDPGFVYATRDLDALEKRLQQYHAKAQVAAERSLQQQKAQLAKETDPDKRAALQSLILTGLLGSHRYRRMIVEAREIAAHPGPPPSLPGMTPGAELAAYHVASAAYLLKDKDALLRDGESFLQQFPSSIFYSTIDSYVKMTITGQRKEEEGKAKAHDFVAGLWSSYHWDVCYLAAVYKDFDQKRAAQRLYRACIELGIEPEAKMLKELVWLELDMGDWEATRRDLARLRQLDQPTVDAWGNALDALIPVDG